MALGDAFAGKSLIVSEMEACLPKPNTQLWISEI